MKELFPENSIVVGNNRENNLKDLLLRSGPYNIKKNLLDNTKDGYKSCKKKCDSWNNFVDEVTAIKCFATGTIFKIRRDSSCQMENVIYIAYCLNCQKQGVSSTVSWKPCLKNYKLHIKNNVKSCKIVRHYNGVSNLCFIIVNVVNNVDHFLSDETEGVLLQKELFWIGTLVTQHKGLNRTHEWRRTKRFWIVYGNQFYDLQCKSTRCFLYSGNTGIKKHN